MAIDKKLVAAVFLTSAYFAAAFFGGLFNNANFLMVTGISLVPTIIALVMGFLQK